MEQLTIPNVREIFEEHIGHWHIGSNMVGYLPESDIFCAANVQEAAEFFLSRLQEARDEAEDMCYEIGNGHVGCEWRQLADEIEKIQESGQDNSLLLQQQIVSTAGTSYTYRPPVGADIRYWIEPQAANRHDAARGVYSRANTCEIWKEQQ